MANEPVEVEAEVTPVAEDVVLEEVVPDTPTEVQEEIPAEELPEPTTETEEDTSEPPQELPPDEPEEIVPTEDDQDTESIDTEGEIIEETIDEPPVESVVEAQYLVTEENFYQFSKNACVLVGDGAFHCSTNAKSDLDSQAVVYAEQGASGNMEIFLKTSRGTVKQITENAFDDTAPHYDPESMRVVWQRLIDGRFQIIIYDIMEEKETQLTFSKTNNMEPKVSEVGIVWQAWDNEDWEIMYFDGGYTEQLTDNESQDVAPVIQDGYVLWSILGTSDQEARVYSLDTKETISITGHDGGSITNPRFVLVYDTEFENGDTITQSFDPATGLSEPIASRPAPEPIDIPENDPTGEIRALLNQGKNQKDETDFGDLPDDGNDGATTTSPDTLNLKSDDGSVSPQTTTLPTANFELTEYDLVIPPGLLDGLE